MSSASMPPTMQAERQPQAAPMTPEQHDDATARLGVVRSSTGLINVPCQQPLAERQTGIHLNSRFRRAEAFTVEPRPIEAANASLPRSEHRAGIVDPTRASLWPLGGDDPVDPISARDGRDVRPQRQRFRGGRESLPQICRHPGFRFLSRRRDLQRDDVARICARSFAHLPVHYEPVASLAVRLERGSKGEAVEGAFNRRHAPRGELRTGVLWQGKKGPRDGLRGRRRPEQCRSETDLRSGFGHCCRVPHPSAVSDGGRCRPPRKTFSTPPLPKTQGWGTLHSMRGPTAFDIL